MNWLLGTAAAMAMVLAGALLDGPSDTQAASLIAATVHDAQAQAQQDARAAAQQARIDAALAGGQADLTRLNAAMAQGRPDNINPADWALAQRAVAVAVGAADR